MLIAKSVLLFILAGLCERGGISSGYGCGKIKVFGMPSPGPPVHFGRVYAAYGGIFVALSMELIMKFAILGDIHGNIEALKAAYKAALEEGVDKIYHLGDLGRLCAVRKRGCGLSCRARH